MKKRILGLSCLFILTVLTAYGQEGRVVKNLDQDWQFYKGKITKNTDRETLQWERINIPHTWNNIDMQQDSVYYEGDAWYKKTLFIPEKDTNRRLFLKFDGVGNVADVYVNDRFIGEHKGGYAAFTFEITDAVHPGEKNRIKIKVNNEMRPDVIPINHALFANYGGIYRHVHLINTARLNISTLDYASPGVFIDQQNVSDKSADISVSVELENKNISFRNVKIKAILKDEKGREVQASAIDSKVSPQGVTNVQIPIPVMHPHLWNGKKDPYLYSVHVKVLKEGKLVDEVTQPLGIRSFHIEPGKGFYLNGKPYRLYGVARHQDWWKQGNALTDSMQRVDMEMIDDIGATSVRFAHYQQADIIYSECDSMGILAWAEIPFVNASSGKEGSNAKQQLTELIKQNYNHPSIFTWGLHNEVYTKYPTGYPARLTHELNDLAKDLDPYRPTVSTSGYGTMERNMNLMANIQAMNRYFGWYYGKLTDLKSWVEGLEKKYPKFNVVLSEYGAGANIKQHTEEVKKPKNVISGQFFPEEYQTKYHVYYWSVIEQHPYLLSSYVWNMFDFCVPGGWNRGGVMDRNLKGLVTFDRQTKKDAFYWYKSNWSKKPVIHIAGRRLKNRTQRDNRIEVFSNLDHLQLTLNNKKQKTYQQGANECDFVWKVKLRKGKNTLKATGLKDGRTYSDTIIVDLKDTH